MKKWENDKNQLAHAKKLKLVKSNIDHGLKTAKSKPSF